MVLLGSGEKNRDFALDGAKSLVGVHAALVEHRIDFKQLCSLAQRLEFRQLNYAITNVKHSSIYQIANGHHATIQIFRVRFHLAKLN
jgi:hypothetical protein